MGFFGSLFGGEKAKSAPDQQGPVVNDYANLQPNPNAARDAAWAAAEAKPLPEKVEANINAFAKTDPAPGETSTINRMEAAGAIAAQPTQEAPANPPSGGGESAPAPQSDETKAA